MTENSNKEEHKEIPETTDECEDEQLSTHGGGGNPDFVILTFQLVEDMVLYTPKKVSVTLCLQQVFKMTNFGLAT